MSDVTVTAIRSFEFQGRSITKGADVTMHVLDAAVERRKGNVTLSRELMRAMKAEPKSEPPPTRRRRRSTADESSQTYRRRDMTAEEPT